MNHHNNTKRRAGLLLPLILAAGLGSAAVARADVWTFQLVNEPSALFEESPTGEFIQMSGSGTFDPQSGTVTASGSATVFNAADHPAPPLGTTLAGTWTATGFVSFEPSSHGPKGGILILKVHFSLALGAEQPNALLILTQDGIDVTNFGPDGEVYSSLPGGSVKFHTTGKAKGK
jgi:hypothetical protein